MKTALLIALIMGASPAGEKESPSAQVYGQGGQAATAERPQQTTAERARQLRQAVSEALREEATSEGAANGAAVLRLISLYDEVVADPLIGDALKRGFAGRIRRRLESVAERIQQSEADGEGGKPQIGRVPTIALPPEMEPVVYQRLNQFGRGLGRGAAEPGEALMELIKSTIAPNSWEDRGGPGVIRLFGRFGALGDRWHHNASTIATSLDRIRQGAGGAAVDDYGDELVELIQTVVAPHSWDVQGGPGTIYYYRPLRVLVIRQTDEVHREVRDAVGQLRAAGR